LHTRLGHGHQIRRDALEFGRGHADGGRVLGVRDAQVLLVNVHKLEVVLGDPVGLGALKHKVQNIGRVLGLEREDVLVLRGAQNLGERGEVDAERNVAVAAEWRETLSLEHHGHKRDMAVVHCLEGDAAVIAVEVAVLHQVLDRVDDLHEKALEPSIESDVLNLQAKNIAYLLQNARLLQPCFQHGCVCQFQNAAVRPKGCWRRWRCSH
jgi:hypothetical protein